MNQVITIHPDGLASGLQRKRDKGLDLRTLGAVMITRVSLIEWDDNQQAWFISFVAGPRKGTEWNMEALQDMVDKATVAGVALSGAGFSNTASQRLYFEDYDEAVSVEIAVLDQDRLDGVL